MVKVKTELGLTLRLFQNSQYEFIRPNVGWEFEIESEKDIKPQIELAIKALEQSWEETTNQVSKQVISQMPQVNKEMELQISKKLQQFEKELGEVKKQLLAKK